MGSRKRVLITIILAVLAPLIDSSLIFFTVFSMQMIINKNTTIISKKLQIAAVTLMAVAVTYLSYNYLFEQSTLSVSRESAVSNVRSPKTATAAASSGQKNKSEKLILKKIIHFEKIVLVVAAVLAFSLFSAYEKKIETDIFTASFLTMSGYALALVSSYFITRFIFAYDIMALGEQHLLNRLTKAAGQVSENMNVSGTYFISQAKQIIMILPSFLIIITGIFFHLVATVHQRLLTSKQSRTVRSLRLPVAFAYLFILLWAAILWVYHRQGTAGYYFPVLANLIILNAFCFMAQGAGVVSVLINNKIRSFIILSMFITVLFYFPAAVYIIAILASVFFGLGLLDQWFNYRKI
ncbi:MAG TPA: hypothetical protein VKS21_13280 [Spirochaetota bacterium]|nr:hypothetical protein [Spirochaetota bacterium]